MSGQALQQKQCAYVAHECTQGSAPNLGIDLFFSTGSRTSRDTRTKKLCAGCFDSHQNSPHKVCPKPVADTSDVTHHMCSLSLSGTLAASRLNAGRPGGIINKARGMATSAPGATGYPRGSQQRAGTAPGAPHEPNIVAPAHTADKASHRIPDGPDTSFSRTPSSTRFHPARTGARTHENMRQVPMGESALPVDARHPSEPRIRKVMDRGSATNI